MKNDMSIAKVVAMFMIVGCHLSEWFGVNIVAMILNVGVEIFLFVSGYLYANKNIGGVKSFIKKKFLKICIPTYIAFLITALINNIIFHTSYFYMTLVYLLNLQGINFIFNNISLPVLDSLGQLWFMTIIFINYLILIIVKKIENRNKRFEKNNKKICVALAIFFCVAIALAFLKVNLCYSVIFFAGYLYGKKAPELTRNRYIFLTIIMLIAMLCRIITRHIWDGTIFYNNIIVNYTHMILGIWIIVSIQIFYFMNKTWVNKVCKSKAWRTLNAYTMPIYVSHYPFLIGNLNVSHLSIGVIPEMIIFVFATLILAFIVKNLTDIVYNIMYVQSC